MPEAAAFVNVGGTDLLIRVLEQTNPACRLVFTSSIAIWGDRRQDPLIRVGDQPKPESHDVYAHQKLQAEALVRASRLGWSILRLTYIVSTDKLGMDPLLFEMPLDTPIEICHASDVALALRHAAERPSGGETFAIAGGESCRTFFAAYLHRMLELFGFGRRCSLPAEAWSSKGFHCAWMDTEESQRRLEYQCHDLEDYFAAVGRVTRFRRWLVALVRPVAWAWLLSRSPYWRGRFRTALSPGCGKPSAA
jgi:nucleoside-diphosphate-sugar epimerase